MPESTYHDEKGKVCSNCGDYLPWLLSSGEPSFYFLEDAERFSSQCRECTLLKLRLLTRIQRGTKNGVYLADIPLWIPINKAFWSCARHRQEMLNYRGHRVCRVCHFTSIVKANRIRRRRARSKKAQAAGTLPRPIPDKSTGTGKRTGSVAKSRRRTCPHSESERYYSVAENRTRCRKCRKEANARGYRRQWTKRSEKL